MSNSRVAVTCPDEYLLQRYLAEELAEDRSNRLEEHISGCVQCQNRLKERLGILPGPFHSPTRPQARNDTEVPELPSTYEALDIVGSGGMGVVWRVRDREFGRTLAVKVMKPPQRDDARLVQRFIAEAQITGQLSHPFVVPVHALGYLPDGRPYYTMRLIEGDTLSARLQQRTHPGHQRLEFIQILGQVCQAVAFAHAQAVIHRDLKPSNIMVGKHGEVQLMDWGLAKVLTDAEGPAALPDRPVTETWMASSDEGTHDGKVLGTFSYMAPEQARGRPGEVDRRSDVFGLGAILCQILTGAPPYEGATSAHLWRQARDADLADAEARLDICGADPELIQLTRRCLSRWKSDRPADAGEVAAAVSRYLAGVEERLHEERIARERQRVQAHEERRRRRLWFAVGVASLLVVGVVTAAGVYWQHHQAMQQQEIAQTLDQARVRLEQGAWTEARGLLDQVELRLSSHEDHHLQQHTETLQGELRLAQELDRIRFTYVTWTNGTFDCSSALDAYRDAFTDSGIDPLTGEVAGVVRRIQASTIDERLVAAIDDWAWLSERERQRNLERHDTFAAERYRRQRDRLLQVAHRADRNADSPANLRDPALWDDSDAFRAVAQGIDPAAISAELLVLIGKLLPDADAEVLWRRGLTSWHVDDFWLHAELGTLLLQRAAEPILSGCPCGTNLLSGPALFGVEVSAYSAHWASEAVPFYQAAIALQPDAVGPYLDLSAALLLQGKPRAALTQSRWALELQPENADIRDQVGLILLALGQKEAAIDAFEQAVGFSDAAIPFARWHLAELLCQEGRFAEAIPLLQTQRESVEADPYLEPFAPDMVSYLDHQIHEYESMIPPE